jgi:hypothetical protein
MEWSLGNMDEVPMKLFIPARKACGLIYYYPLTVNKAIKLCRLTLGNSSRIARPDDTGPLELAQTLCDLERFQSKSEQGLCE